MTAAIIRRRWRRRWKRSAGLSAFRERQRAARDDGRHLGLGLGCYVEGTGVGPFESALVRIDPSGKIFLSSGGCPQGQGMETIFAQVVADAWRVHPDDVVVTLADTAAISIGFGTLASRTTVTLSAAIHGASEKLRAKVFAIAANLLECAATDLELRNGRVGIVGVPGAEVTLAKVAQAARPGWDHGRPAGRRCRARGDLLFRAADGDVVLCGACRRGRGRCRDRARAHRATTPSRTIAASWSIRCWSRARSSAAPCRVSAARCLKRSITAPDGQPLTTTLMEYMLPTAEEIPRFTLMHQHSPSPLNPFGVKGVGEGGPIAPPAALANAIADALRPLNVEFNNTPIAPHHIVAALRSASMLVVSVSRDESRICRRHDPVMLGD